MPLNPINSKPFNFKIFPITSFIDLSKVYLYGEFKIGRVNDDGSIVDLDNEDDVGAIQMPSSTFIKNLTVLINGREVYDSNQLYSYKAYFDVELSYPTTVKDSFLTCTGYHRDASNQNDLTKGGLNKRKKMFASNNTVQFKTKLNADLFNQDLYLINNCEVSFVLVYFLP